MKNGKLPKDFDDFRSSLNTTSILAPKPILRKTIDFSLTALNSNQTLNFTTVHTEELATLSPKSIKSNYIRKYLNIDNLSSANYSVSLKASLKS